MHIFRRAALRAASQISTQRALTIRPAARVTTFEPFQPALSRSFHQSPACCADASDSRAGARDQRPGTSVFIGNVDFNLSSDQIREFLERFGEVADVDIATQPSGMSKGFAFARFTTPEAADRAMREGHGQTLGTRRAIVDRHTPKPRREPTFQRKAADPSPTLFIGNLSYDMSDRDLNDLFREIKNVTDVRVAIDRRTGQPRGFAHADFVDVESAQRAKEYLQEKEVYGRLLKIDFAQNASRSTRPE